jgi:putative DNA primase/helicase
MRFRIDCEPIATNGRVRARLVASQDETAVWADTIDLGSAIARNRFHREVASRADVSGHDIDAALLAAFQRQTQQAPSNHCSADAVDDPHRLAAICLNRIWKTESGEVKLAFWRDDFYGWDGVAYFPLTDAECRALVTAIVRDEFNRLAEQEVAGHGGRKPKVTRHLVADVLQALASLVLIRNAVNPPAWRDGEGFAAAENIVATPGGLLDLAALCDGRISQHSPTPRLFTPNGLTYYFLPDAPCPQWLYFLQQVWPGDADGVALLQEFFGYCLLPDTSQQKMLLLLGPRRSGRGTMMRVLQRLIGDSNVACPTLTSLGNDFGLEPLLGKLVAVINDARFDGRRDTAAIVETLLSISGEDSITINRKNRSMITTKLPTRFVIVTNELPGFRDASRALTGRLLTLQLNQSWYGHEDQTLTDRLLTELPGILNWAVTGLRRLRDRGHFVQPESGREIINQMEEHASPIHAFICQRCEVAEDAEVLTEHLYQAWCQWCQHVGIPNGGAEQFGRDLRAAMPRVARGHPRVDGRQAYVYRGIRLAGSW